MQTPPGAELADDVDARRLDAGPDEAVDVLLVHLLAHQQSFLQGAVQLHVPATDVTHGHVAALVQPDADPGGTPEAALAMFPIHVARAVHARQERLPATLHLPLCTARSQRQ